MARHQLFSLVVVLVGEHAGEITSRTRGGLTGSVVALWLSRVPIESSMAELASAQVATDLRLVSSESGGGMMSFAS